MTEREVFIAALHEKDPAARAAILENACANDPALRERIEQLLREQQQLGSFLERPAEAGPDTGPATRTPTADIQIPFDGPGSVIGPYKLIQEIGEGGMGTVYMAQQTEPVKRMVALKLIKLGMDSKQVLARFEAERQALALMDHPNIAKVLDAGTTGVRGQESGVSEENRAAAGLTPDPCLLTPVGRPYFVMELVKGVPITKFCDQHRLTPRQRLELFVPVCHAIQHAHQKGIIHRDIKPSNVLVALYDDRPVPKVIDFGVAKAAGQPLTEQTLNTAFGSVVGTLEYMSPEQASFNQLDIDTRSDIYSLGVLLYELLAGSPPFSRKELEHAGMIEMLRVVREQEPSKPSMKLSTAEGLPTLAANRGTEPAKLTKLLRGELDWIVMKALEKDRNRRYETANGLAMDVQRYLADEPVLACPPSAFYRLRKFARRNKGPVLATSIILLLLVAGIAGTTTGLVRAITERDEKEEARRQTMLALNAMTDEVVEDLLGQEGVELTDKRRDFLKTVLEYHAEFPAAKANDADGRRSLAQGYFRVGRIRHRLGDHKDAEAAYRDAITQQEQLVADFPTRPAFQQELATSQARLGEVLAATKQPEEAKAAFRAALSLWEQVVAEFPQSEFRQELAQSHIHVGHQLRKTGQLEEAETAYRNALKLQHQLVADCGPRSELLADLAVSHLILSHLLSPAHRKKEANEAAYAGLDLVRKLGSTGRFKARFRHHFGIITGAEPIFYTHGPPGVNPLVPGPEAERQSWQKLWHDVADMLQRAAEKTAPDKK